MTESTGYIHKCPACGDVSLRDEWNTQTDLVYGTLNGITKLGEKGSEYCVYVCPKCGDESEGYELMSVYLPEAPQTPQVPVKIKRLRADALIPLYATEGAAGFDIAAVEDVIIEPGATAIVPTGFAVELPDGYELQIRPRSGISLNTKLRIANAPGTVDRDFTGEVGVIVDNIYAPTERTVIGYLTLNSWEASPKGVPDGTYIIRRGDRIAQGVIAPVYRANFVEVEELTETERGDGGYGSTGTKTKEAGE